MDWAKAKLGGLAVDERTGERGPIVWITGQAVGIYVGGRAKPVPHRFAIRPIDQARRAREAARRAAAEAGTEEEMRLARALGITAADVRKARA